MVKVITAQVMADLEKQSFQAGALEELFMEKAGTGIAEATRLFAEQNHLHTIYLLVGKGNNGGDAFVAGRKLLAHGLHVQAIQLEEKANCSPLCRLNRERFEEQGGGVQSQFLSFSTSSVILDGLFGTGFKGEVKSPYKELIEAANQSGRPILAIDIPSGLNGTTGEVQNIAIHATQTLYLELPKTGFFLDAGWNYVGELKQIFFGLDPTLIEKVQPNFELIDAKMVVNALPVIQRRRHKYMAGYVIGLAGSLQMPGAALLSSLAALRGGSGMVRLLHPKGMEAVLANSPYELIKVPYEAHHAPEIVSLMEKGRATFIGPGLGREREVTDLLNQVIPSLTKPCVIDADALNLFAQKPYKLPPEVIFTPHMGEMQTLLNQKEHLNLTFDLLQTCQNYATTHHLTLILKGAPSFIFQPGQSILVNPTGDPGMATAGSGDVLTGLLASLLSQGLDPHQAAFTGVYLHGLAGQIAVQARKASVGMIATDLISHFAAAYTWIKDSVG